MSTIPQLSVLSDAVASASPRVETEKQTLHAFILARIRATSIAAVAAYCQVPELTIRDYALGVQPHAIALERMRARYEETVPAECRVADSHAVHRNDDERRPARPRQQPADDWAFVRGGPEPTPRNHRSPARGHAGNRAVDPRTRSTREHADPDPGASRPRKAAPGTIATGAGDPAASATDTPTMDQVRALVKRHADARGGRAVAREVGISPMGLLNFIRGASPYLRVQGLLRDWYHGNAHLPLPGPVARHEDPLAAIPEEEIREALRLRIQETSVRRVATEIGITHGGLQLLIDGETRTQDRTRRKLRTWYLRQRAETGGGTDEDTARAAIGLLVDFLPAAARARAAAAILRAVRQESSEAAVPPPAWAA